MENIKIISDLVSEMEIEADKLENKGIKAAAPRLRKILQTIGKACKAGRQEAQNIKNGTKQEIEKEESENTTDTNGNNIDSVTDTAAE